MNVEQRSHRTRLGYAATCLLSITGLAATGFITPARAQSSLVSQTTTVAGRAAQRVPRSGVTPRALAAAPAGRLGTQGCTGGTTKTCTLWAKPGTVSLQGMTVPIWGWATSATEAATLPGPILVVDQGDTVQLEVHNGLGSPLSLAIPGLPNSTLGAGFDATSQTTGGATGSVKTYSFTASRPGTYVYEAGHTADGARQVAMGVAGVLVVRASDPSSAYGTPASAYNDEAVIAMSEIDPAFNANPTGFDLRNFNPSYRLINGKSFPEKQSISTDQGHAVLLRYANLGLLPHSMELLGQDQTAVARDAHALTYPEGELVETVTPGETADTITRVGTGPDAKVALLEAANHLDNDAQTTADPMQAAFGGMLTFLDTNAPVPSGDLVGPSASHVSATPNPSDATADVTVTADLSDVATGNSNIDQAEYVIDAVNRTDASNVAPGFGIPMTGTFGGPTVNGATATIPAAVLSNPGFEAGKHVVYIRAHDTAGNWGVAGTVVLNVPKLGPLTSGGSVSPNPLNASSPLKVSATADDRAFGGTIAAAEYFVDLPVDSAGVITTVPANGSGTAMSFTAGRSVSPLNATVPATKYAGEGLHHIYAHAKDTQGLWGPMLDIPFTVDQTGPVTVASALSPSILNGQISDPSNPGFAKVTALVQDLNNGSSVSSNITQAVAFFDDSAAPSATHKGMTLLAVDGSFDSPSEGVYGLVPLSQVRSWAAKQGAHQLYVYGMDAAGNWGPATGATFVVDTVAPKLTTLSASVAGPAVTPPTVQVTLGYTGAQSSAISYAEVWIGSRDPGVGRATRYSATNPADGTVAVSIPLSDFLLGTTTINARVLDAAGNWSNAVTGSFVNPTTALQSANFDSNPFPPSGWSKTGSVSRTTKGTIEGAGSMAASGGNAPAYVSTQVAPARDLFNAQLRFRSGVSVPAGQVVTVFEALSGSTRTIAVQARGTGAGLQVAPTLAGQPAPTGTWVTVGTDTVTIHVTWDKSAATYRFQVYSATGDLVSSQTLAGGSTSTATSLRFGLIDQSKSVKPSGSATFDSFLGW